MLAHKHTDQVSSYSDTLTLLGWTGRQRPHRLVLHAAEDIPETGALFADWKQRGQ